MDESLDGLAAPPGRPDAVPRARRDLVPRARHDAGPRPGARARLPALLAVVVLLVGVLTALALARGPAQRPREPAVPTAAVTSG
jgi:hypothetical protein